MSKTQTLKVSAPWIAAAISAVMAVVTIGASIDQSAQEAGRTKQRVEDNTQRILRIEVDTKEFRQLWENYHTEVIDRLARIETKLDQQQEK